MYFNLKLIYWHISKDTILVKLGYFNKGVHLTRSDMLFSERNGRVKYLKLINGWRFKFLPVRIQKFNNNNIQEKS